MTKEKYKLEAHNFNMKMRGNAYLYCGKCGCVMMKNEFSQWCQRMGCNAQDHPQYDTKRFQYTKLFD